MSSTLAIDAAQFSDRGVKPHNEDACGIRIPEGSLLINKGIAVAIADGVSSSEAGREASETCIKGFLSDYYSTPETWTVKTSGQKVLGALNRWLYGRGQSYLGSAQGLLTTFSAIIIKSTTAHLFHIGDSRIWRFRAGQLECLTRDHQSWNGRDQSFLNRAMGADLAVEIDYLKFPVESGDIYLLTTDGVHEYVSKKALLELCQRYAGQEERCTRAIITRALENGSGDNVTCQLFAIKSLPNQDQEEFYQKLTELPFPPPLVSGQSIDGYKILRELHASKRSQLYLALDRQTYKTVVIKTPSVNFEDEPQYIDGFLQEEWAGRRIHNDHVLKVLESNNRRRFLYIVTEYIDGQTLEQWINDHPQASIAEVRPIIEQIVIGVRAFQRKEMVHQDLKPSNIMINSEGTVKIIDFGSTKIAGTQEISSPVMRGELLGTLDYAAPEYFQESTGTSISDIYSIGVIAYEMLTGKLPYGGPLNASNLRKISYTSARHIKANIPAWIDGALEKAVALNPVNRYQIMSEFIVDLATPNPKLIKEKQPLLERNPLLFWRSLSSLLILLNLIQLYFSV